MCLFIVVFWCLVQPYGDKKDDKIVLELLDKVGVQCYICIHISCLQPTCKFGKIVCILCNTPICTLYRYVHVCTIFYKCVVYLFLVMLCN